MEQVTDFLQTWIPIVKGIAAVAFALLGATTMALAARSSVRGNAEPAQRQALLAAVYLILANVLAP